jgi:hypothetical protein
MTKPPPLWRLAFRSLFLLVGLLFSVVGLVFGGVGVMLGLGEHAFDAEGRTLEATILNRGILKADFDRNPSTRYFLRYRYQPPQGAPVIDSRTVSVEEWERSPPGTRTQVRAVAGAGSRDAGASDWGPALAFSALGLLLLAAGLPLAYLGAREVGRKRRVWQSGVTMPAVVTDVAASSAWINGVQQWEIRYAYTDASGVKHTAKSDYMPGAEAKRWHVGAVAAVLVDPQAGESSVWTGSRKLPA